MLSPSSYSEVLHVFIASDYFSDVATSHVLPTGRDLQISECRAWSALTRWCAPTACAYLFRFCLHAKTSVSLRASVSVDTLI